MEILGISLVLLGGVLAFIGNIWFLVAAFRVSIWWGLACLFLPFVSFFFLIVHWNVAKRPFFYILFSIILLIAVIPVMVYNLKQFRETRAF